MDAKTKAMVPLSLSGLEVFTGPKVWTDLKETIGKSTCTQRSQLSEKDRIRRDLRILRGGRLGKETQAGLMRGQMSFWVKYPAWGLHVKHSPQGKRGTAQCLTRSTTLA